MGRGTGEGSPLRNAVGLDASSRVRTNGLRYTHSCLKVRCKVPAPAPTNPQPPAVENRRTHRAPAADEHEPRTMTDHIKVLRSVAKRISSYSSMKTCKTKIIMSWILQLIAAVILFQTLFFKFTGAEESKY